MLIIQHEDCLNYSTFLANTELSLSEAARRELIAMIAEVEDSDVMRVCSKFSTRIASTTQQF